MKKVISILLILILSFSLFGCEYYEGMKKISGMSYKNELFNSVQNGDSYSGIRMHASNAKVSYFENLVEEEFYDNFKTIIGEGHDFIWCVEGEAFDIMAKEAVNYPDIKFAVIDSSEKNLPDNFITLSFREEEGGFLAGYIAANVSKTGIIGYLAGKESLISKKYEYGFIAGTQYAMVNLNKKIEVKSLYIEEDYNHQKGKDGALTLYNDGECDVIFHSLQTGGFGAIEAAKENDKLIIGSVNDQSSYAPSNVVTSIVKNTKLAVSNTITKYLDKQLEFGTNYEYGIKDRMIDLSKTNRLMDKKLVSEVTDIKKEIANGEILVPDSEEELNKYIKSLNELKALKEAEEKEKSEEEKAENKKENTENDKTKN